MSRLGVLAAVLAILALACGDTRPGPQGSSPSEALGPGTLPVVSGRSPWVATAARHIPAEGTAGRISASAPEFDWREPDGSVHRLSDLRGRSVVVNFWATWCVPCRTEMPTFNALAQEMRDVDFLMLDLYEDPGAVREFAERLELFHLRLIIDDGSVARAYGLFSLPQTYYVSPEGVIEHIDIGGPLPAERIKQGIARATRTR